MMYADITLTSDLTHENTLSRQTNVTCNQITANLIQRNIRIYTRICRPFLQVQTDHHLIKPLQQMCTRTWGWTMCTLSNSMGMENSRHTVTYFGFFFGYQDVAENIRPGAAVGVFHVFYEKAAPMAMQKHAKIMCMKATNFVNPGQILVIAGDCPFYALQKKC